MGALQQVISQNNVARAKGNAEFITILKVMRALDLKITARAGFLTSCIPWDTIQ